MDFRQDSSITIKEVIEVLAKLPSKVLSYFINLPMLQVIIIQVHPRIHLKLRIIMKDSSINQGPISFNSYPNYLVTTESCLNAYYETDCYVVAIMLKKFKQKMKDECEIRFMLKPDGRHSFSQANYFNFAHIYLNQFVAFVKRAQVLLSLCFAGSIKDLAFVLGKLLFDYFLQLDS